MKCRKCGACCKAPSISSHIPGMPDGKPAMTECIHLDDNNLCLLYGKPQRPEVCNKCKADVLFCSNNYMEAVSIFCMLEK